jgi:transcription elongation factor Elf1
MKKKCPRCNKVKSAKSFGYRGKYLRSHCKQCSAASAREHYNDNPEKVEAYRAQNKEVLAARKKAWRKANPDYNSWYYEQNKNKIRKNQAGYSKKRCASDPTFKLRKNLRTRLYHALKGGAKNGSAVRDMGCTVEQLKEYLESKFQPGMTWDSYGVRGWHIDHIQPLAAFNLTKREELLKACHYTNLQPLWAEDNLRKSNAYLEEQSK